MIVTPADFRGGIEARTDLTRCLRLDSMLILEPGVRTMKPNKTELDKTQHSEEPLENQQRAWADEDIEIEGRKPDLGETEEDESEL